MLGGHVELLSSRGSWVQVPSPARSHYARRFQRLLLTDDSVNKILRLHRRSREAADGFLLSKLFDMRQYFRPELDRDLNLVR